MSFTSPPLPGAQPDPQPPQQQAEQADIPLFGLPENFFVTQTESSSVIICFYKYKRANNKITCCKIPISDAVFEEKIERRMLRIPSQRAFGGVTDNKAYRLGKIRLTTTATATATATTTPTTYEYPIYSFHRSLSLTFGLLSTFKKFRNELSLTQIDWTSIRNKIELMGDWPADINAQQQQHQLQQQQQHPLQRLLQPQQPTHQSLPPAYVYTLLIDDAIAKKETCPILYEPLTRENTVVTSCFHVFSREGFSEWRKKSTECPTCRAQCSVTA